MKKTTQSVRLPAHVKPLRYRIMLKPDLQAFIFSGEETMYLELDKPVKMITLHAKDLEVSHGLARFGKTKLVASSILYDHDAETVTLHFMDLLPKGKLQLDLHFSGAILEGMRGLYRSKYLVGDEERFLMTSQFEATDARRAFPCVDEPAAKAIFDVTLMVPQGHTAISNTLPSVVKEHESGYQIVEFQPTPKMSTYLLAMIVGEFEFIETKTKEGVLVRVFTTPGKKHQAQFALDVASKTLSFFNDYFGIPYPLPVLDMIAVPDFEAGAMENWGAVTYRETQVLVDENHSSAITKQWVAITVAHELVHQWFGNLVTMEWWTHLWLNEGFASYIEYVAVDALFPEWQIWNQFVSNDWARALELDGLENTHAIEVTVRHPREIEEIFDAVSYAKGASVIRMLAEYLGEKHFRGGLTRYLKQHSYKNASTEDLWAAFEYVSKKPVRALMKRWTSQPGFPLISVHKARKGLQVRQERFYSSVKHSQTKPQQWSVPLCYRAAGVTRQTLLGQKQMVLDVSDDGEAVCLNVGAVGFYRVDYPAAMLHKLGEQVMRGGLSTVERFGLVNDVTALVEAGKLSTKEALLFLDYFRGEREYVVWNAIAQLVGTLDNLFYGQTYYELFEAFGLELFTPIAELIGFEKQTGERHEDSLLRSLVIGLAGRYGHKGIIKRARGLFNDLAQNKTVDPDIRGVVYGIAARYGGGAEYKQFLKLYAKAHLHEEKVRILRSLLSFRQTALLRKVLKLALSSEVRLQDAPSMLARGLLSAHAREETWQFMQKEWDTILARYTGGHSMSTMVGCLDGFVSTGDAKAIEAFFKIHASPGADRSLKQSLEKIYSNAAWLKRDKAGVGRWLKSGVR